MAFKIEKFGAEVSNAKSILGGISYYRYAMTNNDDITTAGYFPSKLGLKEGDRIWVTPKTKTDADALYIVSNVSDAGVVTVVAAPSEGQTIQVEELPTASADELGKIYQYIGATDANYTNGYFYKCTGAGEPVVYSWSQVDVQPAPEALPDQTGQSGKFLTTDGTDASWGTVNTLPDQTGQSGKFLTTDGTDASWGTINALQNASSAQYSLVIDGIANSDTRVTAIGYNAAGETSSTAVGAFATCSKPNGTAIGFSASIYAPNGDSPNVAVGYSAFAGENSTYTVQGCVVVGAHSRIQRNSSNSVAVGKTIYVSAEKSVAIGAFAEISSSASKGIAIGYKTKSNATGAIQLGTTGNLTTNSDANTVKIANANGNFEIMSADGTIPAARHASLPAADGTYVLKLTISGGVPTLAWVAE